MEHVLEKPKRKSPTPKKKDGEPREVVIYKIEIDGTNFLYVGHTEDFDQRENNHKKACRHNLLPESKNQGKNSPLYGEINRNGGWVKVKMSPMEKFVSTGKLESRIKEQYWIDKIQVARRDAVMMNGCRAYLSPEQNRAYRAEHRISPEQNRAYRAEHRDELNAKAAEYHAEHRDELNAKCLARNLQKMTCACGVEHNKGGKTMHLKSKKHINWVKANETKSVAITNEPEV
jgi:predicted GIY-YIG superfamily endonuclease